MEKESKDNKILIYILGLIALTLAMFAIVKSTENNSIKDQGTGSDKQEMTIPQGGMMEGGEPPEGMAPPDGEMPPEGGNPPSGNNQPGGSSNAPSK